MANNNSWIDGLAGAAMAAAKDTWLGVEASAIIASSPAAVIQDNNLSMTNPVLESGVTALAESHDSISSALDAQAQRDDLAEATDVSIEPTTSLMVDPPSWISEPTELEQSIHEDLGFMTGNESGLGTEGSDMSTDGSDGLR